MISGIVPFEEIILSVKDETGITNLVPYYERIKRMIFKAERLIGYGGSVIRKRIEYKEENGVFDGISFKLPEDFVEFEGISYGNDENYFKPESFTANVNFVHLNLQQKEKSNIFLTYTGMICDGHGNPFTTRNHEEAIVAYIVWKLYGVKSFLDIGRGNKNYTYQLQLNWEDKRDASRGHDAFPNNWKDFEKIGNILKQSALDAYMSSDDNGNNHYDTPNVECVLSGYNPVGIIPSGTIIYYWQYTDPSTQTSEINNVTQEFLNSQLFNTPENFSNGILIPYTSIGRIGFAVKNSTIEQYSIYDIMEQDITDVVFTKIYNANLNTTIYVSNEHYSHSNILFKIKTL